MHQRSMFSTIRVLVFLFESSFLLQNLKKTEKGTPLHYVPRNCQYDGEYILSASVSITKSTSYLEQRAVFQKDAAGKTRQGNLFPHLLIFVPEDTFDSIAAWCIFCRLEIFLHENIHQ